MVEWPEAGTPVRLVVKTWAGETSHEGLSLPPAGPKLVTMKLVNCLLYTSDAADE